MNQHEALTDSDNSPIAGQQRVIYGYPKTGRTWLRFMIGATLSEEYDLGVDVDLDSVYSIVPNDLVIDIEGQPTFAYEHIIPKIEMSHNAFDDTVQNNTLYMFMTRDPRDIMVSHWLHNTHQDHLFDGTVSEYIRNQEHGIEKFLSHLQSWSGHITARQVITYEGMRSNPGSQLLRIFSELGVTVSSESTSRAIELGDIQRMRKIEVAKGIAGLQHDRTNPDARRVRKGKVGGFIDYLSEADLVYIDDAIESCDATTKGIIALTPYYTFLPVSKF